MISCWRFSKNLIFVSSCDEFLIFAAWGSSGHEVSRKTSNKIACVGWNRPKLALNINHHSKYSIQNLRIFWGLNYHFCFEISAEHFFSMLLQNFCVVFPNTFDVFDQCAWPCSLRHWKKRHRTVHQSYFVPTNASKCVFLLKIKLEMSLFKIQQ